MLTVCALFYGDYPHLADRLLSSIERQLLPAGLEFRLATNATSQATDQRIAEFRQRLKQLGVPSFLLRNAENKYKYPVMRSLLYGFTDWGPPELKGVAKIGPVTSKYVMWFDDDSFIRHEQKPDAKIFHDVCKHLDYAPGVGQIGDPWFWTLRGQQHEWINRQPWCRQPVRPKQRVSFITGGFWVARFEALRQLDYPWPTLEHRGGDVMLSVAMKQIGYGIERYTVGVAINADDAGHNAQSPRRGFNQKPIGETDTSAPAAPQKRSLFLLDG